MLNAPPLPWQCVALTRAGELREDGRLRFRIVVLLVSRQNGKTWILSVLPAYWLAMDELPMILGMSTKLDYAQESWRKTRELIEAAPDLADLRGERPRDWYRRTNGQEELWLKNGGRYKIAASNAEGGRSLTVHRLMMDEARHTAYEAWEAAEGATDAVDDAQIWVTSNAGDVNSRLLNDLRERALLSRDDPDTDICLLEWSADEADDPADPEALLQANPSVGHTGKRLDRLIRAAEAAKRTGGEALNAFKVNYLCQWVSIEQAAIDAGAWSRCAEVGTLDDARSRVALCLDVSMDQTHVTLAAAAVLEDDRVRVEVVEAWDGAQAVDKARAALRPLVARIKPQTFGWDPSGPAASLAASLADRRKSGRYGWPPPGVTVEPIRGEKAAVCMGFSGEVTAGRVAHADDPLLNAHIAAAERYRHGDVWTFRRRDAGSVDAAYAAAGAAFLARTLPQAPKPMLVVVNDE